MRRRHWRIRKSLLQCIRNLLFIPAFRLGRSQREESAKQMTMRWKRGRLCLKKIKKRQTVKMFWLSGLKFILSLSYSCLLLLVPLLPQGTPRIIHTSLSALCCVSELYKSSGCTLYICHPFCLVRGEKKICSTPGLWFAGLSIPGTGCNSSLSLSSSLSPLFLSRFCSFYFPFSFMVRFDLLDHLHHIFIVTCLLQLDTHFLNIICSV